MKKRMGKAALFFYTTLLATSLLVLSLQSIVAAKQPAKNTTLKKKQVNLTVGATHAIAFKNKNKKAKYSFRSSNAKVVSVNKNGKLKAKKKGSAKITVKQTWKKKTKKVGTLKVNVRAKKTKATTKPSPAPTQNPTTSPVPTTDPSPSPTQQPPIQSLAPTLVPLYFGPPNQFPSSTELPEGAISVSFNDGYASAANTDAVTIYNDVDYDVKDGETLSLHILVPKNTGESRHPLIAYVPGSAWMRQNTSAAIPTMTRVAERGYTVAIIEYRGTDVAHFPAQAEDAKTAIRFLRKNAETYQIDTEKVVLWGDSSGGHTAVMAGVTGDGALDNATYGDVSSKVNCIIDWYGPTDISLMNYYPSSMDHTQSNSPEGLLLGGVNVLDNPELAQKANPLNYITNEKETPPMLIMHGSRDPLVPFNQSVRLYEKLRSLDKAVEFYKLENASHGSGGFAGDDALNLVLTYVESQLQ